MISNRKGWTQERHAARGAPAPYSDTSRLNNKFASFVDDMRGFLLVDDRVSGC
jgi:hypothetical protein